MMNEDTGTCMTPEQAMRAENAELRAENERLQRLLDREAGNLSLAADACVAYSARIAELEAALTEIHELLSNYRHGKAKARAAAALKGDTSEIRRRASPDDKHPEDRIVH
jgi:septal ring factor EnvC (AmiA/AmiB activator)